MDSLLYFMPLIKSIINTMFCSSIIIVFTLMYFVSSVNGVELRKHRQLEIMVSGVIFHLIAYLALPRIVSPLICIFGFTIWFALLMDIKVKTSFVSVFVWHFIALFLEVPLYITLINTFGFDLSTSIGSNDYYIICFVSNVVIMTFTIILTKAVTQWKEMVYGSQGKQQK